MNTYSPLESAPAAFDESICSLSLYPAATIRLQKPRRSIFIIQVQEQEEGFHQSQQKMVRSIRKEEHRR